MISLYSMIDENTNLFEIYITKCITDNNVIDIGLHPNCLSKIQDLLPMKNWKTTRFTSYSRNDLIYLYDMSNDSQIVYCKHLVKNHIIKPQKNSTMNLYIATYNHSKLPTHLFPCLNDIDDKSEFAISESKISNRVSVIVKSDQYASSIFIEYKHSPQVEIDKIETSINGIIKTISRIDLKQE